ncbi:MAG: hypothetical protein GXP60_05235 [Epsilonproteobacteria bacterium]|nr:hypothetical protein [Campylobacterota bacterium]
MKKYQIIESLVVGIVIILFLSLLSKAFYINKHIRINNAYIWAPQNRFRIDKQGYLIRIDIKALSVIKKGTKIAYLKIESPNVLSNRLLKILRSEQKRNLEKINHITDKLNYALKENGLSLKNITQQLMFISDYLSKLLIRDRIGKIKEHKLNSLLLDYYRHNLNKALITQKRLKRLYRKGLISSFQAKSQDAKILNIKKIVRRLKKNMILSNSMLLNSSINKISKLPKNIILQQTKIKNPKKINVNSNKKIIAEKKPEQYSYITSDTNGIVYKISAPVPSKVYPRDTLFFFYKPKQMRIIAYYHTTGEIKKGADVTITIAGQKIKGRIDEIYYNNKAIGRNSTIKLFIKPETTIAKYPLYTPVAVDVKQSKWF